MAFASLGVVSFNWPKKVTIVSKSVFQYSSTTVVNNVFVSNNGTA